MSDKYSEIKIEKNVNWSRVIEMNTMKNYESLIMYKNSMLEEILSIISAVV